MITRVADIDIVIVVNGYCCRLVKLAHGCSLIPPFGNKGSIISKLFDAVVLGISYIDIVIRINTDALWILKQIIIISIATKFTDKCSIRIESLDITFTGVCHINNSTRTNCNITRRIQ